MLRVLIRKIIKCISCTCDLMIGWHAASA